MNKEYSKDDIQSIECKFAVHCAVKGQDDDLHVVKETIVLKDGRSIPNVRLIKNFKRDYYVTKKGNQDHTSKKEWEAIDKLNLFRSTQTELLSNAARALGQPYFRGSMRDLAASPYLYGTDVDSTAIIKYNYKKKYDVMTPFSNAVFDTETDVVKGTKEIIMATVSYKDKLITAIQKSFVSGLTDVENQIRKAVTKYIGDIVDKRKIEIEIKIVDTELDVIKETVNKAHLWKPDFLSVWNIEFDMGKIIDACDKRNIDPADILSDPSVPKQFKFFNFYKSPAQKKTNAGVMKNLKSAERWHTVFCPSSFYWVDAMQAYKHIRTGRQEERSYSLDYLLDKNLGIRKLKFEEAKEYEGKGLVWHQVMQSKYPIEYIVYNMFDCISMEMLDEKTLDLQLSLPMLSGYSDFRIFNSQPKRSATDIHFFVKERGYIIGSTGPEMKEEFDSLTYSLKDWIVMLPAHMVTDEGLRIINENNNIRTKIYTHAGDLDVSASYPWGEVVFEISKGNTKTEMVTMQGISEYKQRMNMINLSGGHTNAVEICTELFSMPTLDDWLESFQNENNVG